MAKFSMLGAASLDPVASFAVVGDTATALTATGNSQATALSLPAVNNFVSTAAASTGVILPVGSAGDVVFVYNGGANSLTVYPPVGGTINNLSANTGLALATLKSGYYVYSSPTSVASLLSA